MAISERFQGANVVDAARLSPYWGEHAARYRYVRDHAAGRSVLDIACGTGYGLGILGGNARRVVGVDIDEEAARQARQECRGNGGVTLADGLRLPFADETFEMITSFETLEHLSARADFLGELKRVLKTGGTLFLSTPNASYTQPVNGVPENPFHIHEYEPDELRSELEGHFSIEKMVGQMLDGSIGISPFIADQRRLGRDVMTQSRLAGWRALNKLPVRLRERLSHLIWGRPFYPTEMDYNFNPDTVDEAPTLLAVCHKA